MTTTTMQSTFLAKEDFITKNSQTKVETKKKQVIQNNPKENPLFLIAEIKKNSEAIISAQKLKKLKFLLNKTKEAQKFDEQFHEADSFDSETCKNKQCELINNFAKSFIEQAKTSPV